MFIIDKIRQGIKWMRGLGKIGDTVRAFGKALDVLDNELDQIWGEAKKETVKETLEDISDNTNKPE